MANETAALVRELRYLAEELPKDLMKRRLSPKARESLFLYAILVLIGLKDAYLIDCCNLSPTEVHTFLQESFSSVQPEQCGFMLIIVDMDVFIANTVLWKMKMDTWASQCCETVFIDVEGSDPIVTSSESRLNIIHLLAQFSFDSSSNSTVNISRDHPLYQRIGGAGIAGLLLGYPCTYVTSAVSAGSWETAYAHASALLSFSLLHKVHVNLTIHLPTTPRNSITEQLIQRLTNTIAPHGHNITASCLEFTIPCCLLESRCIVMEDVISSLNMRPRAEQAQRWLEGADVKYNIRQQAFMSETLIM